jgi:hypothetical protein
MKHHIWWVVAGAVALCALSIPHTVKVVPVAQAVTKNKVLSNEEKVATLNPILDRVCSCESWGSPDKIPREFDDSGNVLRGFPDHRDVGACQIATETWGAKARALGYNIYTLNGNIQMANYIYEVQGLNAWNPSRSCWQES